MRCNQISGFNEESERSYRGYEDWEYSCNRALEATGRLSGQALMSESGLVVQL
jgi:hypothetical protein